MPSDLPAAATRPPANLLCKLVGAEPAVTGTRPGEHALVGTACATPPTTGWRWLAEINPNVPRTLGEPSSTSTAS